MTDSDKTPMERFEDLARKLFSVVKKDAREAEEAVEDALEPQERLEPDE
jgi:hypothetical protein